MLFLIAQSWEGLGLLKETVKVLTVEDYASDERLHSDTDVHGESQFFLGIVETVPVLVDFLTQFLHLFNHGFDTFLSLFTASHLSSDFLLSEAAGLTEGLSKTLLGTQTVNAALVVLLEHFKGLTH